MLVLLLGKPLLEIGNLEQLRLSQLVVPRGAGSLKLPVWVNILLILSMSVLSKARVVTFRVIFAKAVSKRLLSPNLVQKLLNIHKILSGV